MQYVEHERHEPVSRVSWIDTTALERDVEVASALANETRYELLRLLIADDELAGTDLPVGGVDASQSTVSRGLSTLYEAGLANRRKESGATTRRPRQPSDCWRRSTRSERDENLQERMDSSNRMKDDQNGR